MEWENKIGICFEGPSLIFAAEVTTERNAFNLLSELIKNEISWGEAAVHFAQYLLSNGCTAQQIDEQIIRIHDRYAAWLK
jgi:hypothetical protein